MGDSCKMETKPNTNIARPSFWDSPWKGIAIVAGVFSLLIMVMLFINAIYQKITIPEKEHLYSVEMAEKKALLSQNPDSEELINDIRSIDLKLRQSYFDRMAFSNKVKYLLLLSVIVFLISIKKVIAQTPKQIRSKRKKKDPDINYERQNLKLYRNAIGGMGILLLTGIILLALIPKIPLETSVAENVIAQVPAYPSKEEMQDNWPRFRGTDGLGISTHQNIPTNWDGESGAGILWKTEIILPGNNSPIAWGDKVFITGADAKEKAIFCYSAINGDLLWRGDIKNIPGGGGKKVEVFEDTGYAASTMATDGARVYAIFANGDLACFDYDGNQVWAQSLGVPDSVYTFATSLAMYQNLLLIQYDQGGEEDELSALIAIDGKTGQIAWRQKRPVANSWTTPIVVDTPVGEQIITCSEPWVISYNPATGEELWRAKLMGTDLAPSPVYAKGIAFVVQPNEAVFAIKVDGRGDVTETHVIWTTDCPAPEISSPVCNDEHIYLLATMGLVGCYDIQTGDLIWEHEIEDNFQASPVLIGEWLYCFAESGKTYRLKVGKEVEISTETPLIDEWIRSSPAFMDDHLFIRGDKLLYCIGNQYFFF
jgi:outer membrane protein assembly factor BamB